MTPVDLDTLAAARVQWLAIRAEVAELIRVNKQFRGDLARIAAGAHPITDVGGVVVGAELTLEAFDLLRQHAGPTLERR